jgi:hypothetical protein
MWCDLFCNIVCLSALSKAKINWIRLETHLEMCFGNQISAVILQICNMAPPHASLDCGRPAFCMSDILLWEVIPRIFMHLART